MPVYDYYCEANGRTVEVVHPLDADLSIWGQVCYVTGIPLGETDPCAPVRRVFTRAPGTVTTTGNTELRSMGFTKLVKREQGVYENVTAMEGEKRYMVQGDDESVPHLHRKIRD